MTSDTPKIFISYSHVDEVWKDRLMKHLQVLEREGMFEVWDDRRIAAGLRCHLDTQSVEADPVFERQGAERELPGHRPSQRIQNILGSFLILSTL